MLVRLYVGLRALLLLLAVGMSVLIHPTPANSQAPQQFDYQRAIQNLKALQSGAKQLQQLTPQEQIEVRALIKSMSRSRPPSDSSDCRDAWSRAASAADDLVYAADRLRRCADTASFVDEDCGSAFRSVRSAHSDYEDAVSHVQSYCR